MRGELREPGLMETLVALLALIVGLVLMRLSGRWG